MGEDDDRQVLRFAGVALALVGLWLIWKSRGSCRTGGDRLPGPTDSKKGP